MISHSNLSIAVTEIYQYIQSTECKTEAKETIMAHLDDLYSEAKKTASMQVDTQLKTQAFLQHAVQNLNLAAIQWCKQVDEKGFDIDKTHPETQSSSLELAMRMKTDSDTKKSILHELLKQGNKLARLKTEAYETPKIWNKYLKLATRNACYEFFVLYSEIAPTLNISSWQEERSLGTTFWDEKNYNVIMYNYFIDYDFFKLLLSTAVKMNHALAVGYVLQNKFNVKLRSLHALDRYESEYFTWGHLDVALLDEAIFSGFTETALVLMNKTKDGWSVGNFFINLTRALKNKKLSEEDAKKLFSNIEKLTTDHFNWNESADELILFPFWGSLSTNESDHYQPVSAAFIRHITNHNALMIAVNHNQDDVIDKLLFLGVNLIQEKMTLQGKKKSSPALIESLRKMKFNHVKKMMHNGAIITSKEISEWLAQHSTSAEEKIDSAAEITKSRLVSYLQVALILSDVNVTQSQAQTAFEKVHESDKQDFLAFVKAILKDMKHRWLSQNMKSTTGEIISKMPLPKPSAPVQEVSPAASEPAPTIVMTTQEAMITVNDEAPAAENVTPVIEIVKSEITRAEGEHDPSIIAHDAIEEELPQPPMFGALIQPAPSSEIIASSKLPTQQLFPVPVPLAISIPNAVISQAEWQRDEREIKVHTPISLSQENKIPSPISSRRGSIFSNEGEPGLLGTNNAILFAQPKSVLSNADFFQSALAILTDQRMDGVDEVTHLNMLDFVFNEMKSVVIKRKKK